MGQVVTRRKQVLLWKGGEEIMKIKTNKSEVDIPNWLIAAGLIVVDAAVTNAMRLKVIMKDSPAKSKKED